MPMARFIHDGDSIDYTPTSDVTAGDVVELDKLIGVAKVDIPAHTLGALAVVGVFDFPKLEGSDETLEVGETVAWHSGMNVMLGSTSNVVGHVVRAAGPFERTVRVRLSQ